MERPRITITQDRCNACSLCVRMLGCPGILVTDGKYVIDEELCDGCELCAYVCQHEAIETTPATGD
ncbi:MAG: ATP-binding protein [Phycisphaerae bacterium]